MDPITINGVSVEIEDRNQYVVAYVGGHLLGFYRTGDLALQAVVAALDRVHVESMRYAVQ